MLLDYDISDPLCVSAIAALNDACVKWQPRRVEGPSAELPTLLVGARRLTGAKAVLEHVLDNFSYDKSAEEWAIEVRNELIIPIRRIALDDPLRTLRAPNYDELRPLVAALRDRSNRTFPVKESTKYFVAPIKALAVAYAERYLGDSFEADRFATTPHTKRRGLDGWLATNDDAWPVLADLVLSHFPLIGSPPVHFGTLGMRHSVVGGITYAPFIRPDVVSHLSAKFRPKPRDIFIATYPKCGTTWMQQIVLLLLHQGKPDAVKPHPELQTQAPWLEACYLRTRRFGGPCPYLDSEMLRCVEKHGGRRVFKTHAPIQLAPAGEYDVVYVARNPKDCCNSFFAHLTSLPNYEYTGDFDHFVHDAFLQGKCEFGSWLDHHVGWWGRPRVHYVFFENLKSDFRNEVARLALFLGLTETFDERVLDSVVSASSFETMRERTMKMSKNASMPEATSRFRNGGKCGAWRVESGGKLTDAHESAIDETFLSKLPPDFRRQAPTPYYQPRGFEDK